jgi:hypothetical protein
MLGKYTPNYKYVCGQGKWKIFTVLIIHSEAGTCSCSSRKQHTPNCIYWRHKLRTDFWNHPVVWTLVSVARFDPLSFVGLDTWHVTRLFVLLKHKPAGKVRMQKTASKHNEQLWACSRHMSEWRNLPYQWMWGETKDEGWKRVGIPSVKQPSVMKLKQK